MLNIATSRLPRVRVLIATVLICALGTVSACSGDIKLPGAKEDTAGARAAAVRLAKALSDKDLSSITFSGTDGAADEFTELVDPLGAGSLTATLGGEPQVDDERATSKINLSWRLPGVAEPWTYPVAAEFRQVENADGAKTWQPVWRSSLVHPDLVVGSTLNYSREQPDRGKIIGADDQELVTGRPVVRLGIDKTRVSGEAALSSAADLADLVDIDAKSYVASVKAAGKQAFVEAIVYRQDDPELPDAELIRDIGGAVALEDEAMLAPSRTFAAPILGVVGEATKEVIDKSEGKITIGDQVGLTGLQARYDDQLRGTPEVSITVVPPADASPSPTPSDDPSASGSPSASGPEPKQVFHQPAKPGKDLTITLDRDLQEAAEQVLADVDPASALVAIRPSTGEVVAAANGPGADGTNIATFGQYPPGSVFKIIDALALIRHGVEPSASMDCPSTITVDGRKFENYDDYPAAAIGSIDFRTAFANSCNTAFIDQHDKVDAEDLNDAAASLGLGTDYDVGFPAYFGSIPEPRSETEAAASMIGQGRVQVSPLAMATVAASVQAGRTTLPTLVDGKTTEPKGKPLTQDEADLLQELMRAVVTEGSGEVLRTAEPPAVIAKTGTAEYGTDTPPKTHAWMVATQSDLAVAVFVAEGESGSGVAGPLLREFLLQA
jgi:cell division protein FtsI/penicillin-binding protein 2